MRSVGMESETFLSAEAFLAATDTREPDCLVLDIQMQGTNGLALALGMARIGRKIPVVFITAHDDEWARERARTASAVAYLRKPVSDEVLLKAIDTALRPQGKACVTE
jgi:FixJ family two-component response regulator